MTFFCFPISWFGDLGWAAVGSVLIGHRSGPAAKATNSAPASWHRAGHSHHLRGQIVKKPFDKRHHCTMDNLCSTVDFLGLDWGDSCKVASCCFMLLHGNQTANGLHLAGHSYSTDLYSETNVFGMVGVEAASRMLSEPWWHRSLGPLCRSRSLDFRHAEAWSNRPKNGLAYNMFIMTSTKMEK